MKGYQINEKLYIFPQQPAEIQGITEDITVIFVRSKDLEAWKTANTTYANLFKPYNYETITVLPKPWAGHSDDDFPVQPGPGPEPPVEPDYAKFEFSDWEVNDNIIHTNTNFSNVTTHKGETGVYWGVLNSLADITTMKQNIPVQLVTVNDIPEKDEVKGTLTWNITNDLVEKIEIGDNDSDSYVNVYLKEEIVGSPSFPVYMTLYQND